MTTQTVSATPELKLWEQNIYSFLKLMDKLSFIACGISFFLLLCFGWHGGLPHLVALVTMLLLGGGYTHAQQPLYPGETLDLRHAGVAWLCLSVWVLAYGHFPADVDQGLARVTASLVYAFVPIYALSFIFTGAINAFLGARIHPVLNREAIAPLMDVAQQYKRQDIFMDSLLETMQARWHLNPQRFDREFTSKLSNYVTLIHQRNEVLREIEQDFDDDPQAQAFKCRLKSTSLYSVKNLLMMWNGYARIAKMDL